jgi:hypothetical protein
VGEAELIRNSMVMWKTQDKVQQHLAGGKVTEASLVDLHYLRVVIKKKLRMRPQAPLLLPCICSGAS